MSCLKKSAIYTWIACSWLKSMWETRLLRKGSFVDCCSSLSTNFETSYSCMCAAM